MEIKLKKDAPIGVFDSGVGGISVLRELDVYKRQDVYSRRCQG